VANVRVTALDDDLALTVSATDLTVGEGGGTQTYTIVLASQPTGLVTVTVESNDPTVATVSPTERMFTPDNWDDLPLWEVTVTGGNDDALNDPDRTTTISHRISGRDHDVARVSPVTVTVTDNDTPGIALSTATEPTISALTLNETGGTTTYRVALSKRPTGDVTVTAMTTDPDAVTVAPTVLDFTMENWDQPQAVIVTGVDDNVINDPARTPMVNHRAENGGYDNAETSLTVTVTDNDAPGVTVSRTELTVGEAGGTGTYTVYLNTPPTIDVTVTPAIADPTSGTPLTGVVSR